MESEFGDQGNPQRDSAFNGRALAAACASSFEDGWFAWELSDVRPLAKPIPALAARKIYELDIGNLVFG
ncbi:hypothetical protein [Ochrobactrum sp. Marseille-Q0166]|uniref:hypothetical protein n=1 Tax=Ochrobactrum sp. Marseille-Q0166 TaxID=2761105 RepID=UPI001655F851|nr:hypothetical protein [Ochrobactrum sp. Marseille-Q0166]MBC8716586.1 hypothetical protein [Ochrobactrum sp. Marseille-Q0166]